MKNSIDTIGNRTRSTSTNCSTVGVQAVAPSYSRRPSYVDIAHENHFRKGNNDECKLYVERESILCLTALYIADIIQTDEKQLDFRRLTCRFWRQVVFGPPYIALVTDE